MVTSPDGSLFDLKISDPGIEAGDYRWIVTSADQIKGAKKGTSTGSSSGFINQVATEALPR
jgi:hypothetical protein